LVAVSKTTPNAVPTFDVTREEQGSGEISALALVSIVLGEKRGRPIMPASLIEVENN
jgi:hypothetical protein